MARITVEDCAKNISNPFELIVLAAQRARDIANGAPLSVKRDDDKNTVVALREIAAGTVAPSELSQRATERLRKQVASASTNAEVDEEVLGVLPAEGEVSAQDMKSGFSMADDDEDETDTDDAEADEVEE